MILKSPQPLTEESRMPFGKYAGELMMDVPASYFLYLWEQDGFDKNSQVGRYIESHLDEIMEDGELE